MRFDDTFTFKLESSDGDAVITCAELPLDIRHEIAAYVRLKKEDMSGEVVERYQTAMCESVIEVQGLSDSKGEVTAERVRARKISPRMLDVISSAAWAALAASTVTDEKKSDSKSESVSA